MSRAGHYRANSCSGVINGEGGGILLVLFVVDRLFVLNGVVCGIKKRTHCVRFCSEKWITVL